VLADQIEDREFPRYQLSLSAFDEIARGDARPDVVRQLRRGERSRRLLLLRALDEKLTKNPTLVGPLSPPDEAWEILGRAEHVAPSARELLLAHPYTGAWAGYLTRLLRDKITGVCPLWMHVGHLHTLAAAAAVHARIPFAIRIPVWEGGAILPTVGMARLDTELPHSVAEIRGDRDVVEITNGRSVVRLPRDPSEDATNWWAIRTLDTEAPALGLSVRLDDLDPYRGLYEPVPPQRLTSTEFAGWREVLADAWHILVRCLPELAAGFPSGLDSLVPRPAIPLRNLSASTGEAFGSAIVAKPTDATSLAATLVHEFHHNLLSGLLHLITLYEKDSVERFYTLWRDDPRPISGALSGTHAFFGVTAFWRALSRRSEADTVRRAGFEFAYWRTGVWRTIRALSGDEHLTPAGQRFVDGITERVRPWLDEPVPADVAGLAEAAAADHLAGWRIRHLRPRNDTVAGYAESWLAGQRWPAGLDPDSGLVPTPVPDGPWCLARTDLIRLGLASAEQGLREVPEATPADLAYVLGQVDDAINLYRDELAEDPDRPQSWVGLGLALSVRSPGSAGARALLQRPELVRAVHRVIRTGTATLPEPDELADWIGRSVC
jgi:HEXXH motif-containing protein